MAERFDVIVVGARCAGAPLAALLARKGVRVAIVERATFPRDTLSTHVFQAHAMAFLDRLGVNERIRATGASFMERINLRWGDLEFTVPIPQRPGDVGGITSVRRLVLDPILAQVAGEAGAEIRMATNLVVGADGRNSTIAGLVGARKYNLTPSQRFAYWAFFEGAEPGPDPPFILHRWSDRFGAHPTALPPPAGSCGRTP